MSLLTSIMLAVIITPVNSRFEDFIGDLMRKKITLEKEKQ
jgi:hypothetical protein